MKKILSVFNWLASKMIGRKNLERLLIYNAKSINVNLHVHGLVQIGVLNGFNPLINGENFFIEKILCPLNNDNNKPVFFDVGANLGGYSLTLRKNFPDTDIYSFEPVKSTFDLLVKNTHDYDIKGYNLGFSDKTGTGEIFNTVNGENTEIASLYKDVFSGVFNSDGEIISTKFQMETIDDFCLSNTIKHIDFLKIDVEGHELSVLKGALTMLLNNYIKVIQFEFNTHNVYSRVFLKDFYDILKDFEFFRLKPDGILSLGKYNPINEIFTAQNLVAILKTELEGMEKKYVLV